MLLLPFFRSAVRKVAVPCLGIGQILSSFSRVPWACFWLRFHSYDSWWLGWAVLCLCLPCPKFSSSVGASSFVLEARTWLVLPTSWTRSSSVGLSFGAASLHGLLEWIAGCVWSFRPSILWFVHGSRYVQGSFVCDNLPFIGSLRGLERLVLPCWGCLFYPEFTVLR